MKSFIDCIPCFMQQTIQTGRLCGLTDSHIKTLIDAVGKEIPSVSLDNPPTVIAAHLQRVVTEVMENPDPLKAVKVMSNTAALSYYDTAMNVITHAENPLKAALQVAIAGNIIDYGAIHDLDVPAELERIMQQEEALIEYENGELFAFDLLERDLQKSETLLYVGDNAGEIVFDKALITTIKNLYPHLIITFATRGYPILNDVLLEDAYAVGLDSLVTVVSSGVDTPGLVLEHATEEFRELFHQSDLIISKGQGNLESLLDVQAPIYFLLVAKCQPIAQLLGCKERDIILKRQLSFS